MKITIVKHYHRNDKTYKDLPITIEIRINGKGAVAFFTHDFDITWQRVAGFLDALRWSGNDMEVEHKNIADASYEGWNAPKSVVYINERGTNYSIPGVFLSEELE